MIARLLPLAHPFTASLTALALCLCVLPGAQLRGAESGASPEIEARPLSLDDGWRFALGEQRGAETLGFEDHSWRQVDLPHDWSVEDATGSDPAKGPHDRATPEGPSVGFLRGGVGWYRKHLKRPSSEAAQQLDLILHSAQQECDVWVNGEHVTFQPHGYLPVLVEISRHLKPAGQDNVIAVRVLNPERNSRWYSGSGLYRGASLRAHDALHIPIWGVQIDTVWAQEKSARLQVRVQAKNARATSEDVDIELELKGPTGEVTRHPLGQLRLAPGANETVHQAIEIARPQLWSPESPRLYIANVILSQAKRTVDRYEATFGVRTVTAAAENGLLINGQPVKLKGACLHHDNGILGASAFRDAERRRVRVMKANGFNAIRTSHNPPSEAFLDACDEEGVLVIDEFADTWELPKKLNGYQRYFDSHWRHDLKTLLARDFNHPSVIIWSIGNEIAERSSPLGVEISKRLVDCVRSVDTRRPITNAVNYPWENPIVGTNWEVNDPAFTHLDVGGYNYAWDKYESDHARFPKRVMVGTESYGIQALENWRLVEANAYVIGDFVWTGMDHIGESGIGHTTYIDAASDPKTTGPEDWAQASFPFWLNWSGDIDLIGNKKPASYYRDVVWRRSVVEMEVHEPIPAGKKEKVGPWGWPAELPSWNWPGCEGKTLDVSVYSRAEQVRLELNGRVIAEKTIDPAKSITAKFQVPWEAGTLKAIALNQGKVAGERELRTSGPAQTLQLSVEGAAASANRARLVFLPLQVLDSRGALVRDAAVPLTVKVSGEAELKAFGTANPEDIGSLTDTAATSYRGQALLILRSTGKAGKARVEVSAAGLRSATAEVNFLP